MKMIKAAVIGVICAGSGSGIGFVLSGYEGAIIGITIGELVALWLCEGEEL